MRPSPERADVEMFRGLVRRVLGLDFDDSKLDQLADILRHRLDAAGQDAGTYLDRLAASRDEWRFLAEPLTVAETYFFRYRDHFRAFADVVLADCGRFLGHRPIRILSAGAASGEEAYSLAILARACLAPSGDSGLSIVGIDVNPQVIRRAVAARFSAWSLRETPADLRGRYFATTTDARTFALRDEIRTMVTFEERNLIDDDHEFWRADAFDVVFCRNVLMYMTPDAMQAVVDRVTRSLRPGGFLFLGHAETLRGLSHEYHLRHTHETFYYQKRADPAADEPRATGLPAAVDWSRERPVALAAALGLDNVSWIDAIGRATARVAALTERVPAAPSIPPSAVPAPAAPRDVAVRGVLLELMRQERLAEALEMVRGLPEASQADPEARLLHAILLTNAGRLVDAEAACRELLKIDELSAGAHYLTALCREHAGDRGAAVDHDQTAAYLEPGFVMPHLHLGILERRSGHAARARSELGLALALLPAEDASRILLFGGGFGRDALMQLCRSELQRCGVER